MVLLLESNPSQFARLLSVNQNWVGISSHLLENQDSLLLEVCLPISTYSKERSGSKMPRGRPLEGGRPPLLPSAPLSTPRAALRLLVLH